MQRRAHLCKKSWVSEGLAEHGVTKHELWMAGSHISHCGKSFEQIAIVGLKVINAPGRVEMPDDQIQGTVEVFDEGGPTRYIERSIRHGKAELDMCHKI